MATIIIKMLQEPGHLIPSFNIAKQLQNRGHRIVYTGNLDFKEEIVSYGFEFTEVFNICKGNVIKISKWGFLIPKIVMKTIKNIRDCRDLNETVDINLKRVIDKYNPDLFLLDDLNTPDIISLKPYNIPVVLLSTYLSQEKDTNTPPLHSTFIPKKTIWSKIWVDLIWLKFLFPFRLYTYFGYYKQNKLAAKKKNYPLQKKINHFRSFLFGIKDIPTIVLCPKEFDFPRENKPSRFYVAPNFVRKRKPVLFNWSEISSTKPIVYCCLGTQARIHFKGCIKFYNNVIRVFSNMPEYTLIISIWKDMDISQFQSLPSNVKIYNEVPQIEILKRSKLMITHGGLGSIKESISFGVPMLVYPVNLTSDQKGNAARVVYHKIGLRGKIRKESIKGIRKKINYILSQKHFIDNINNMKSVFGKYEKENPTISIIEKQLRSNKTIVKNQKLSSSYVELTSL